MSWIARNRIQTAERIRGLISFQLCMLSLRGLIMVKESVLSFRRLVWALLLIHVSLIAAFITRFVIMFFFEKVGTGTSYWQFVHYTLIGYRNSAIPIFLITICMFHIWERWVRRALPMGSMGVSVTGITMFFGTMVLIGTVLRRGITFPRNTWILAWLFCVAIFTALTLLGKMEEESRERLIYNRVWHFFIDATVICTAFGLSYVFRFDGIPPWNYQRQFVILLPYCVILYLAMNLAWRVYAFVWRFTGLKESVVLFLSSSSAGMVMLLARILYLERFESVQVPFGVLLALPCLTFVGFISVRMLRRIQFNYLQRDKGERWSAARERRVLLVGAGDAGMMLVRELERHRGFSIVGFLDDDRRKQGTLIGGIHVLGTTRDVSLVIRERVVNEVIICIPTAPKSLIRRVAADCDALGVVTSIIPSLAEIVLGKVKVSQLRPVRMEDLLGRASVEFSSDDRELMETYSNRRIMVTGAAGSIGSELVRQLREYNPKGLLLLDKDENGLFEIALDVREEYPGEVTEIVGDIRNKNRMERIFERWKPEVIFHAAAYKHVPMMEYHPSEAVLNNIVGTKNMVDLASERGVKCFVLISTDKAVNPTSVMGASKRVAETIVRYRALHGNAATRFCCVRFGNVLGSRASVVPVFQRFISKGKNLRVTHPDIRRYFMTIPEAAQLVIQAGSLGWQGETFVLDMGDPVKIIDLARELIEQSGLVLGKDIQIEFTGLRPGEKLFEELLLSNESGARNTRYSKIFVDRPIEYDWTALECALKSLEEAARKEDSDTIYRIFQSLNIGYRRRIVCLPAASGRL